ncbi:VWA domain-containing protein [Flavobacterium polysaccharolyticum]|uniref:VWA domain-containing protein n=1 Tax=Flavobacterium polysaccharolyticum TaxID=3133148 RepID=A0ABU9NS63_9FLAO
MQFKHPEILYFLFLLLLPILVHLFQLRKFKTEYFTNVRFLKKLTIESRKSSKIKKRLLLATRLLLLTGLIIAFAQPFFEAKDHKNATNELYIILDNSFSMQAKGNRGELLKRAVQELLEEIPESTTFSLLTNDQTFWNTNIKSIQSELQNLNYSAIPFKIDTQLAKIKARKSAFKKDIVILSDAIGISQEAAQKTDKEEIVYFIQSEAEQKNNVAIDSVYINQTLDNFYEITVAIRGFGDDFNPLSIALYNQNKLIAKTMVTPDIKKKTVNFTIPRQEFHGYATINDKALTYDNDYFFSISKNKKISILSIGESTKSEFLSRIFTIEEFNYSNSELRTLDYNTIEKQATIVLNEIPEIPQALQTTLQAFVNKGGNLVIIPSENSTTTTTNTFLKNLGNIQFIASENNSKQITKINFDHPLFSGVFESKITNFQYPKAEKSFVIKSAYPSILSYEDQTAFLTAIPKSVGAVFIFSAPLNPKNSNFQQSPLIVPVFYKMGINNKNALLYAATIGDNTPFWVNTTLTKEAVLTVKGKEEQFIPIQQMLDNKVKLTFADLPKKSGNYTIYNKEIGIENISFNYARTESDLNQVNTNWDSSFDTMDSIKSVFNTLQTNRTDYQLWKWFLIFALAFLLAEMAIIRFVK